MIEAIVGICIFLFAFLMVLYGSGAFLGETNGTNNLPLFNNPPPPPMPMPSTLRKIFYDKGLNFTRTEEEIKKFYAMNKADESFKSSFFSKDPEDNEQMEKWAKQRAEQSIEKAKTGANIAFTNEELKVIVFNLSDGVETLEGQVKELNAKLNQQGNAIP